MKTKIINIEVLDESALADLEAVASLIRSGGTVVFPTETVYAKDIFRPLPSVIVAEPR